MRKINVLYLSPVPDFKGGAERSLFDLLVNPNIKPILAVPGDGELAERARSMGISVAVVGFGAVERVRRPFKVSNGVMALRDAWRASRRLIQIARENQVEVIHTNGLKAHAIAVLTRIGASTKLVMHFRDIAYTPQEKAVWRLQARLASRAIFVSRACYPGEELPANGRVIFNGVDPKPSVKLSPSDPIRIGFIGRIHPHKGLHTLLDWMRHAKDNGLAVALYVRGKFSQEAIHYEEDIKAQMVALGLEGDVHFQGFVADPDTVYQDIDVVCAPAQAAEPLARTILEPMNIGLPVIATPTGGTTEMVLDKITGFIAIEAADFTQALQVIKSDSTLIANMATAGREHINKHFSKQKLHSAVYSLYSELLNENQPRA